MRVKRQKKQTKREETNKERRNNQREEKAKKKKQRRIKKKQRRNKKERRTNRGRINRQKKQREKSLREKERQTDMCMSCCMQMVSYQYMFVHVRACLYLRNHCSMCFQVSANVFTGRNGDSVHHLLQKHKDDIVAMIYFYKLIPENAMDKLNWKIYKQEA